MTLSGVQTNFFIKGSNPSPRNIAVGPDGNPWFTEFYDSHVSRITPSGVISRFALSGNIEPWDIIAGPDGNLWFTESQTAGIGAFNPRTGTFLPRIALAKQDIPTSIAVGADGNLWFTDPSYTGAQSRIGIVRLH